MSACLAFLALAWAGPGAGRAEIRSGAAAADSGPTLAREDTLPVPRVWVREVEVRARRVGLDEILDRIAEGEARRDSLIHDQVCDLYARAIAVYPGSVPAQKVVAEQVTRIYRERPDRSRTVEVRRSGDKDVHVYVGPGLREEIVDFAFRPQLRKLYRFEILGRDLAGGHIVYRLGFEPRSRFYHLPSGRLWVDTNVFVILRQEFWYRDGSPEPLLFKSMDDCVVERTLVDGQHWVLARIAARVTFAVPILGIPPQGDMVIEFRNYRINRGIDPAVFSGDGGGGR